MAGNPVPDDVYPSSAANGNAIPLDTARPVGCIEFSPTVADSLDVVLADDVNLVNLVSTVKFSITYGSPIAVGAYTPRKFVGLPNVIYDLTLPKEFRITTSGSGSFVGNLIQKWGQIKDLGSYYTS